MHGTYAIVDLGFLNTRGIDAVEFARHVISSRPAAVQLRAKEASPREALGLLRQLVVLCRPAGVPLFANDRPDLAVIAECDGVHVGQEDLSVADVRRFAPGLRVGVSTHDEAQLRSALRETPDYVAFGPVFATGSKVNPDPVVGLEGLSRASQIVAGRVPLVAIGGIDVARAAQVSAFTKVAAVISALLPPEGMTGVADRVCALNAALAR